VGCQQAPPGSLQLVAEVGPRRLGLFRPSGSYSARLLLFFRYRAGDVLAVAKYYPNYRPNYSQLRVRRSTPV